MSKQRSATRLRSKQAKTAQVDSTTQRAPELATSVKRALSSISHQTRQESQQVQDSCSGGTRLWRGQAAVGILQGALPGPAQERNACVHGLGAGQHLSRSPKAYGTGTSMTREAGPKSPTNSLMWRRGRPHGASPYRNRAVMPPHWRFDRTYSAKP